MSESETSERVDTRPSAAKQALPGAKRGPTTFYMAASELHIAGWDDDDKNHWSYNPSAHDPIDDRLKRWIKSEEGNFVPVIVVRENDRVYVKAGRDRTKAMRELAKEAESAGDTPLLVLCTPHRGREGSHFAGMVLENSCRKVDNPITRAELSLRALKYMDEAEAADLIGVKPDMMKRLHQLLDLCADMQKAVASGEVGIFVALKLHGTSAVEQKAALAAWRAGAPKPVQKKSKAPRPKKVYAVLAAAESWAATNGDKHPLAVTLLKWFAGYIDDNGLMQLAPHLAVDLKVVKQKKVKAPKPPKVAKKKSKKADDANLEW